MQYRPQNHTAKYRTGGLKLQANNKKITAHTYLQGDTSMVVANFIAYILCIIGALNWGLYGIFDFNLVSWIFQGPRTAGSITLYVIIAVAALWLIISPIISGRGLRLSNRDMHSEKAHR